MSDPNTQTEAKESNLGNTANNAAESYQNLSLPGFQTAEHYYRDLTSGNPGLVSQALEPQTSQIEQQYAGAVQNAKNELARGGAEGDVTHQLDNQRTAQLAGNRAQAVASAYPALTQLSSATGELSVEDAQNALQAFNASGQLAGQNKASTMGLIGGLAGSAATAYAGR